MNEYFSPSSTAYLDLGQCFQNCALTLYSITFPWLQTANQIIGYSVSPHLVNRIDVEISFNPPPYDGPKSEVDATVSRVPVTPVYV